MYRLKRGGRFGWHLELSEISRVLRGKRMETVTPDHVLAAQGMLSALSVGSYKTLDSDADGLIDMKDIVRAFARVDGISFEQSTEIAGLIMEKGDAGKRSNAGDGKLSFAEFVSVLSQDMMPFHTMLGYMDERAARRAEKPSRQLELGIDKSEFEGIRRREVGNIELGKARNLMAPNVKQHEVQV